MEVHKLGQENWHERKEFRSKAATKDMAAYAPNGNGGLCPSTLKPKPILGVFGRPWLAISIILKRIRTQNWYELKRITHNQQIDENDDMGFEIKRNQSRKNLQMQKGWRSRSRTRIFVLDEMALYLFLPLTHYLLIYVTWYCFN